MNLLWESSRPKKIRWHICSSQVGPPDLPKGKRADYIEINSWTLTLFAAVMISHWNIVCFTLPFYIWAGTIRQSAAVNHFTTLLAYIPSYSGTEHMVYCLPLLTRSYLNVYSSYLPHYAALEPFSCTQTDTKVSWAFQMSLYHHLTYALLGTKPRWSPPYRPWCTN